MKIITYLSKQWTLRWRDWIIATTQAAAVAAGTFLLDQLSLVGLHFNFQQIATASVIVFVQHILRKLLEPNKLITMQKVEKEDLPKAEQIVEQANEQGVPAPDVATQSDDGDPVPPPIADPTNPKPPKGEIG